MVAFAWMAVRRHLTAMRMVLAAIRHRETRRIAKVVVPRMLDVGGLTLHSVRMQLRAQRPA